MARLNLRGKRYEEAERELREALRQDPRHPQIFVELGKVLARQGRTREAIASYEGALAIEPRDPAVHHVLGILHRREGDLAAARESFAAALESPGASLGAAEIYRVYFHGPAYQVLESAWKNGSGVVGLFADPLPPNHVPDAPTLVAPRLVELSFQTAGVFELGTRGIMGLPLRVERVRAFRAPETATGRLHAVVTPSASGDGSYDARVVDADGNVFLAVEGYRTVELPGAASAGQLEPFRAAMA